MGNFCTLVTPKLFIDAMEKIAVAKVLKAIHTMNMWKMSQQLDETVRAFAARITGTAKLCGMIVTCGVENSYRDKVVMQVLLHGIRENDIRSKVLSRNTSGELLDIHQALDYIEAEEAGLSEASDLHEHASGGAALNAINKRRYGYQQKRNNRRLNNKCRNCRGNRHGDQNTVVDRETHCKAFGKTCEKCGRLHHFAAVCKSGDKPKLSTAQNKDSTVGSITVGQFFPITASTPSSPPDPSRLPGPSTWSAAWTRKCPALTAGSWTFPPLSPSTAITALTVLCHNRFAVLDEEPCPPARETATHHNSATSAPISVQRPRTKPGRDLATTCVSPPAQTEDILPHPPTCTADLGTVLASLHSNPAVRTISTVPLPHQVHSILSGWLASKPASSPSLYMEVCLDRSAYA